jgi:hypothetical protein
LATLGLTGCVSAPEPVEPREFSENNSYAYNIANQTTLTRNDSPLRDFTQEEIDEVKTNLVRKSGGDAALFFGSLRMLTGDFTGLIDVAGGSMANLSNGRHRASFSGWYVTIPQGSFKDGLEAKEHVMETIQTATRDTLESKGNKLFNISINGEKAVAINDPNYFFGLQEYKVHSDTRPMILVGDTYQVGSNTAINGVGSYNFNPFIEGKVKGYEGADGFETYLKDLTARLPENYVFYGVSFPKSLRMEVKGSKGWNCSSCIVKNSRVLTTRIVPAIYTQGKKYEFIKPEVK